MFLCLTLTLGWQCCVWACSGASWGSVSAWVRCRPHCIFWLSNGSASRFLQSNGQIIIVSIYRTDKSRQTSKIVWGGWYLAFETCRHDILSLLTTTVLGRKLYSRKLCNLWRFASSLWTRRCLLLGEFELRSTSSLNMFTGVAALTKIALHNEMYRQSRNWNHVYSNFLSLRKRSKSATQTTVGSTWHDTGCSQAPWCGR